MPTLSPVPRPQPDDRRRDQRHAARVALGLLVPGVVLLAIGHPAWMLYAVFGSFAGMYGRLEPPAERLRHQFHGAGMLVTGVALGVSLAQVHAPATVMVCCETAFAVIGSLITDQLRLRPGGPFFGIFAFGATATVAPGLVSPWVAVGICAGTALLSMLLSLATPLLLGSIAPGDALWPRPVHHRPARGAAVHALRYALATGTAGFTGLLLGLDHANWAMAGAAVPLAVVSGREPLYLRAVVHRGMHRVMGTFGGLLVTALMLLPNPSPLVLAATVMVLVFPTELFMSRHYGVALGFFTPLIMIMTDLAEPADATTMLLARGVDTVIGVAAGVAAAALITGRRAAHPRKEQAWAE